MATGELLLRNGTIIDPGNNINAINDLLIRDGRVWRNIFKFGQKCRKWI